MEIWFRTFDTPAADHAALVARSTELITSVTPAILPTASWAVCLW